MYGWQKIFHSVAGWNPMIDFVPAVPAAVTLYLSVYIIGQSLRQMVKLLAPAVIREYLLDFVKTMTFCAYPFGHGIARKYYGEPGYFIAMLPLMTLTILTFPEGSGNPIGTWLNFHKKKISFLKAAAFTVIEMAAGQTAYRIGMLIFTLELHPFYVTRLTNYYEGFCESDLRVPIYAGFLIELCGMIYETWFSSQTFSKNVYVNLVLKLFNAAILVSCGVRLTGMYMHPAMASAHSFGCGKTPRFIHVMIYWVGPMIGSWISVQLQKSYTLNWFSDKKIGKQPGKKNKEEVTSMKPTMSVVNGTSHGDDENKVKKRNKKYY